MDRRKPDVAPEVVLAVWQAEDGRCEACGRAMDKRFARVTRLDDSGPYTAENLHLLCVDCKARRADPLKSRRLVLGGAVATRVLGQLAPEQLEPATRWLAGQLKRHGVIVMVSKDARRYWLPGVATFGLRFPDEATAEVDQVDRLTAALQVKSKPQACTRGLPRPDRSPMAPPAGLPRTKLTRSVQASPKNDTSPRLLSELAGR